MNKLKLLMNDIKYHEKFSTFYTANKTRFQVLLFKIP